MDVVITVAPPGIDARTQINFKDANTFDLYATTPTGNCNLYLCVSNCIYSCIFDCIYSFSCCCISISGWAGPPFVSVALTSFVSSAFAPAQLCVNLMINVARESAPKLSLQKDSESFGTHSHTHTHGTTTAVGNCLIDYSCKYTYYSMLMPTEQARERAGRDLGRGERKKQRELMEI